MKLTQLEVQHLLLRLGFGVSLSQVESYIGKTPEYIIEREFSKSKKNTPITFSAEESKLIASYRLAEGERRMEIKKKLNALTRSINIQWLKRMVREPSGVADKMAFFWHDHFACSSRNPVFVRNYVQTLREGSLGNFGDLLRAVSKEPIMLHYLNNVQNKKKAPNENFAREVMELFTLGRDQGYTENDIKEAARSFTGWMVNKETGEFLLNQRQHDEGQKTIFGKTANFSGDDVLDMLLENKQTAHYISEKWVRFFVNYEGNSALQRRVADALYESNYDIQKGLTVLFTDDAFYKKENIGLRIKSPIELVVGLQRMTHVRINGADSLLYLQNIMGQRLLAPPNVAGWPDGYNWVDSSTLLFRLNLPRYLFRATLLTEKIRNSFDANDQLAANKNLRRLEADIDLDRLQKDFEGKSASEIEQFLLQSVGKNEGRAGLIPDSLMDQLIYFMSKPEFQLC